MRFVAVDGVSFDVRKGETFGLLGPNGAGKTTTISMLVGVLRPDGGSILVNGAAKPTQAAARLAIGIAPQTLVALRRAERDRKPDVLCPAVPALGREAARASRLGARIRRTERSPQGPREDFFRRHEAAAEPGGRAGPRPAGDLFLDEPTVGVDPQSRNHIFDRVEAAQVAESRTIIYTTHYMEEAQRLCDRVAIMDHGKILDLDRVDALDRSSRRALGGEGGARAAAGRRRRCCRRRSTGCRCDSNRSGRSRKWPDCRRPAIAFQTLEVARPDLETVFLTLTGRSLRD